MLLAPRGEDVVRCDQEPAMVLGVDRVTLESGPPHQIIGDLGRLAPPATEFDAASAFGNEVVVKGKGVRLIDGERILEVDESHRVYPEGVIGTCHIDAGLAVDVAVLCRQP